MTTSSSSDVRDPGRRRLLKRGLYGAAGVFASPYLFGAGCSRRSARPNVLLVVLDTARADRFSFAGYRRTTSPSIDALAADGTVHSRAFSTCFWTLPSHATLFTGLYPSQAGATSETNELPRGSRTIAAALKEHGYDTGAFVCNPWINTWRGFGKGFSTFVDAWKAEGSGEVLVDRQPEEQATRRALAWLDQEREGKNPFFLFMNLNRAHLPYEPEEIHRQQFLRPDRDPERVRSLGKVRGMWDFLGGAIALDETDFEILNELYDGEIANADAYVGEILDFLRANDLLDDTLVIITSDHGENIGDHGMIDHLLSMYDSTLHVPLVARYPGRFEGGVREDGLVSLVDIAPTILDVCGCSRAVPGLQAARRSLCGAIREPGSLVIAENDRPMNGMKVMRGRFPDFDVAGIDNRMRAVRTDRHKLIWREGVGTELYDLEADPGETRDLGSADADLHDRLMEHLDAWQRRMPAPGAGGGPRPVDRQSMEALRSLGYVK